MAYHSPEALLQNVFKICQQVFANSSSVLTQSEKFRWKCPEGFGYDTFNPRAQPSVWAIFKLLEMSCSFGSFRDSKKLGPRFLDVWETGCMIFIGSMTLSCEPELYNTEVDKQPLWVENELVLVGKTSFKVRGKMFLPKITKPVAETNIQVVFVDKETHKPTAPPRWWVDKYTRFSDPREERVHLEPFDFSKSTEAPQQVELCVQSSDMDCNCHVNNTIFPKFCYEAYVISHVRRFGYTGAGDPFRNVKHVTCAYRGEAGLGDLIQVFLTPDPCDADVYHFRVVKKADDRTIFECRMQFYPQTISTVAKL